MAKTKKKPVKEKLEVTMNYGKIYVFQEKITKAFVALDDSITYAEDQLSEVKDQQAEVAAAEQSAKDERAHLLGTIKEFKSFDKIVLKNRTYLIKVLREAKKYMEASADPPKRKYTKRKKKVLAPILPFRELDPLESRSEI